MLPAPRKVPENDAGFSPREDSAGKGTTFSRANIASPPSTLSFRPLRSRVQRRDRRGICFRWKPSKTGVPHLSPLLRKVGTTPARSAVVAVARVERTLLSAAFDVAPDLDLVLPATDRDNTVEERRLQRRVKFEK